MVLTKYASLHKMNKSELIDYITEYQMFPSDEDAGEYEQINKMTRKQLLKIAREKSISEGTFRRKYVR